MKLRRSIFNDFSDFPIENPTVGTKENVRILKEIELLDFKLVYLGAHEELEVFLGAKNNISSTLDRFRTFLGP